MVLPAKHTDRHRYFWVELSRVTVDAGTGGHRRGRCISPARETAGVGSDSGGRGNSPPYTGVTLRDALEAQYSGSFLVDHPGASSYNELAIDWRSWEDSLPYNVEAFAFAADEETYDEARASIATKHRAFLLNYGLTATEVPLLRYRCSQIDPINGTAFLYQVGPKVNVPAAEIGECWHDVS